MSPAIPMRQMCIRDRFYNRIARLGSELLLPGGKLYFEINQAYGRETAHILEICLLYTSGSFHPGVTGWLRRSW